MKLRFHDLDWSQTDSGWQAALANGYVINVDIEEEPDAYSVSSDIKDAGRLTIVRPAKGSRGELNLPHAPGEPAYGFIPAPSPFDEGLPRIAFTTTRPDFIMPLHYLDEDPDRPLEFQADCILDFLLSYD